MKMHNVIARAQHMLGGNTYIGVLGVFRVPGVSVAPGVPGVPGFPMQSTYLLHYTYVRNGGIDKGSPPANPRTPSAPIRTSVVHVFHFFRPVQSSLAESRPVQPTQESLYIVNQSGQHQELTDGSLGARKYITTHTT